MAHGDLNQRVARRIAEVRRSRGLAQREVAVELDIAVRNYQRMEYGDHSFTLKMVETLAAALGVDVDELLKPPSRAAMRRNPAGRPRRTRG